MKFLIVDDTVVYRKILLDVLSEFQEVTDIISAPNGKIALEKMKNQGPDVITLDYEMPQMNGLEVLKKIKQHSPETEVIMISAHTPEGADIAIEALDSGALDVIAKPEGSSIEENVRELKRQLRPILAGLKIRHAIKKPVAPTSTPVAPLVASPRSQVRTSPEKTRSRFVKPSANGAIFPARIIAIGASTGGPKAVTLLLSKLPENLKVPIVMTLHMPAAFTGRLAESLNEKSKLTVVEAKDGQPLRNGTVYLAPGNTQMKVVSTNDKTRKQIQIKDDPPENNCKPSVDYLFRSIAKEYGPSALGIILTGMGADGVAGMKLMKIKGARTVAQNEETCVVFGMPQEAIKAGIVDTIMPIDMIHTEILRRVV